MRTVFGTGTHADMSSITRYGKISKTPQLRKQVSLVLFPEEMYRGEQPSLKTDKTLL